MGGLIDRQSAIDRIRGTGYADQIKENVIMILMGLPSVQPEANCSEIPNNSDTISRAKAIEALTEYGHGRAVFISVGEAVIRIEQLPPAQPGTIYCKDCKYAEVADQEDSQDGYTCQFHRGSIWFSGSYCSWAERRRNENNNV